MEGKILKPILDVQDLSVYYGDLKALNNIVMNFYENTVHAIMGPSGCGKSTLIRCFNRLMNLLPRLGWKAEYY